MTIPELVREPGRLAALRAYRILDSLPEQAYNDIVELAAFITRAPIAVISLIDEKRQWFKARRGMPVRELPLEHAFCTHTIQTPDVMVVPDASCDERFADSPYVRGAPHIRFYAGAPLITPTGEALGTLCVLDSKPHEMSPEQESALRALSREVIAQMELRRSIAVMEEIVLEQTEHVRRLEEEHAALQSQSMTDMLTQVGNRRAFQTRLTEEIEHAKRHGSELGLAMIDVDHFKAFNDTFGHVAGDEALRELARILRSHVRSHDLVTRYGGEEFAVILPATSKEGALLMGERFRREVQRAVWPLRPMTVSVGVATLAAGRDNYASLLQAADRALYRAKAAGRNRVVAAED